MIMTIILEKIKKTFPKNCFFLHLKIGTMLRNDTFQLNNNLLKLWTDISNNILKSFLMKGWVLKGSKSSMCSPVPIKTMGDCVAATALKAPPPFA